MSAVAIVAAALSACSSHDDAVTNIPSLAPTTQAATSTTSVRRAPIPVLGDTNKENSQAKGSIPLPKVVSLRVMDSPVGPILVTPSGRAVYFYEPDGTGKATCRDQCAVHWPAVNAATQPPDGDGVNAKLGTIDRENGVVQVTINGRPAYFYRNDEAPGSVNGQGVAGQFWLVGPDGQMIKPA